MNEEELYTEESDTEPETSDQAEKPSEKEGGDDTVLIAKKEIGIPEDESMEPGYKCTFEVVKDYGGEVMFKKVHKKQPTEDEELSMMAES